MKQRYSLPILVFAPAILLMLTGLTHGADDKVGDETALAGSARSYVENFLAGKYEQYVDLMGAELKSAFSPELAGQVRQQILGMNGAVKTVGDAWMEDEIEGNRRFRVPTEFENRTMDLRVVFDPEGKVTGFFQVPHVPSPAERATDETLRSEPNPAIEGHWEGSIEIPGAALGVLVDLEYKDGYWTGTIDIPSQGARGLPLSDVSVGKSTARFAIAGVPGDPNFEGTFAEGAITGQYTQAGQRFPFRLGREKLARPKRPQEPEPPFPYQVHEVSFDNGEIELAGTLTAPEGEGRFPAALLLSGSGAQDRNEEVFDHKPFLVLADHLTRSGIAVLRVDDRGVGSSGGSFATATSKDFADDALAGVNFLRSRDEIDPKKIGLIGHSEGGIIAPKVAGASDDVAWIILLGAPGVPGDELLVRQVELLARAAGLPEERIATTLEKQTELLDLIVSGGADDAIRERIRELLRAQAPADVSEQALEEEIAKQTLSLTSPWYRCFLAYDPRAALRGLKVPVLALYGEKDLQVDPEQNIPEVRKALGAGGNKDYFVEEMPGLNHLFQKATTGALDEYYTIEETLNPAALERITGWILERFGSPVTKP